MNISRLPHSTPRSATPKPVLASQTPFDEAPEVYVTAHLDAKASGISSPVLGGAKQLQDAVKSSEGALGGTVQVSRRNRFLDIAGGTLMAVPGLAMVGAAAGALVMGGAFVAGGLFALAGVPLVVLTSNALRTGIQAAGLNNKNDLELGQGAKPSPAATSGVDRLRMNMESAQKTYPGSKHVVYLSGHGGDGKTLAGLKLTELREKMTGTEADVTVLDTCSSFSLEVLSNLAPWAGLVVASTNPVPAFGYPIKELMRPENLSLQTPEEMACQMAYDSQKWTFSMNVADTSSVKKELLPSLDRLGQALESDMDSGQSKSIRRALRKSTSVGWGFRKPKYMDSFLQKLEGVELSDSTREALQETQDALDSTIKYQKNGRGLSFDRKGDASLPEGWNSFLEAAN